MIMAARRGKSLDGWSRFNLKMADLCDLVRRCPTSGWLTRFPTGAAHSWGHESPFMQWRGVAGKWWAWGAHFSGSDTRGNEVAAERGRIKSSREHQLRLTWSDWGSGCTAGCPQTGRSVSGSVPSAEWQLILCSGPSVMYRKQSPSIAWLELDWIVPLTEMKQP